MDHGDHGDHMDHMDHMDHGAIGRRADGSYYYTHGAWLGHVVPGTFFVLWGLWWTVATFDSYIKACAANKRFESRAWYKVFFGPAWLRQVPLEPLIKVILPFFGALGELWLGHESYRALKTADGKFLVDNINDWQHSCMYLSFMLSGVIDLVGHYGSLPKDTEHSFLSLAFISQGLLLVFHLKGPSIEIIVHLILVIQIFATFVALMVEGAKRDVLVVAVLRPILTLLQGVWWIQTAQIMYVSDPAYDPEYMGGTMMAPAVFVFHLLWVSAAVAFLLLGMRWYYSRFIFEKDICFTSEASRHQYPSSYTIGQKNRMRDDHGIYTLTDHRDMDLNIEMASA
jgi:hypothetical protein